MKGPPRISLFLLAAALLAPVPGGAAERYRVGVLFWHDSPNDKLAFDGFREGLRLAGIYESIHLEVLNVERDRERGRAALARWKAEERDLVLALGTSATILAGQVLTDTPVVFTAVTNPVGAGILAGWEEGSGTNLCGNSNWIAAEDVLTVFRAAVPDLARLGVVYNPANPVPLEEVNEAKAFFRENRERRLALYEEGVRGPDDLAQAVTRVLDRGAQAVWVPIDDTVYAHLDRVLAVTVPRRIPVLTSQASAVPAGAIAGVAVDYRDLGTRAAVFALRILRDGADPGTLLPGRMRAYRVLVNLDAARRIGFELPLTLLATADDILEETR